MKRLLLIVALALISGACATIQPVYHAVTGPTALIPPMSTFEPAASKATTPRPPAPEIVIGDDMVVECPPEILCDPKLAVNTATPRPPAAPTSNNLKGKLNKGLAPYVKLDWSAGKQSATAPVAVAKSASVAPRTSKHSEQELKGQINNLLAQIDSLQGGELKATQAERDKAFSDYILSKQETAILERDLTKVRSLLAAKRGGDMQWNVITWDESQDKDADPLDWIIMGIISSALLVAFMFALGWRNGKIKAEDTASARIIMLEDARKDLLARNGQLEGAYGIERSALRGDLLDLQQKVAEKERQIAELKKPPVKPKGKKRPQKARAPTRTRKKASPDALAGPTTALPSDPVVKAPAEFGFLPLLEDPSLAKG